MVKRHRRGFVKEAEEYALEFRRELEFKDNDPLCPFKLADHLEVPVIGLSKHPTIPEEIKKYFATQGNSKFSATALVDGPKKYIIHNDFQHPNRQTSNIMHELAHIILGHPAKPPMLADGCRNIDARIEKEANDLGFTLLIPKPAALRAVEEFPSVKQAALFFNVSEKLLQYRIRKADAFRWAQNRARFR